MSRLEVPGTKRDWCNKEFKVLASNCSGLSLETRYLEQHIVEWRDESTIQTSFYQENKEIS